MSLVTTGLTLRIFLEKRTFVELMQQLCSFALCRPILNADMNEAKARYAETVMESAGIEGREALQ